jgi:hypothetical protein
VTNPAAAADHRFPRALEACDFEVRKLELRGLEICCLTIVACVRAGRFTDEVPVDKRRVLALVRGLRTTMSGADRLTNRAFAGVATFSGAISAASSRAGDRPIAIFIMESQTARCDSATTVAMFIQILSI